MNSICDVRLNYPRTMRMFIKDMVSINKTEFKFQDVKDWLFKRLETDTLLRNYDQHWMEQRVYEHIRMFVRGEYKQQYAYKVRDVDHTDFYWFKSVGKDQYKIVNV